MYVMHHNMQIYKKTEPARYSACESLHTRNISWYYHLELKINSKLGRAQAY